MLLVRYKDNIQNLVSKARSSERRCNGETCLLQKRHFLSKVELSHFEY